MRERERERHGGERERERVSDCILTSWRTGSSQDKREREGDGGREKDV